MTKRNTGTMTALALKLGRLGLAAALSAAAMVGAQAKCSRPIQVPLAPMGLISRIENGQAKGIYAEMLKEAGQAAGCDFRFITVPRARAQRMLETGETDIFLPAVAVPSRVMLGDFVPLLRVRPVLIRLRGQPVTDLDSQQLLADTNLKISVVRSFSYGPQYETLTQALKEQGRLSLQADVAGVIMSIRRGTVDAAIINPAIFLGELLMDPEGQDIWNQLEIITVNDLPWLESGAYISRKTLREADRRTLAEALGRAGKTGRVWEMFIAAYPPGSMDKAIHRL